MPQYEVLPCKLNREEMLMKGAELSTAIDTLQQLEEDKKTAASSFKDKIERQSSHVKDLARTVRTGEEDRSVEVIERYSIPDRKHYTYRTDTGEVVRIREMSQREVEEHTQGKLWPIGSAEPEPAASSEPARRKRKKEEPEAAAASGDVGI